MFAEANLIYWEPAKTMLNTIAGFIPSLLGALVTLLAGLIIARFLEKFVAALLEKVKFNEVMTRLGFADLLSKGGVNITATGLLSGLVHWMIVVATLAVVMDMMGLRLAAGLLNKVIGYIPNVASAVFVALIGMFFASLLSTIVKTTAANYDVRRAELLASITKGGILLFTTVMALDQLEIKTFFPSTAFLIFFGAVCFALALSFGLGGKDLAAKILWDFYNKQNVNK